MAWGDEAPASGRSSGRVVDGGAFAQASGGAGQRNANDCLPAFLAETDRRLYLTSARAEALAASLSPRELAVIHTLDTVRLGSARQLERLHFIAGSSLSNARRCRATLERLTAGRLLARLERRVGGRAAGSAGFVYTLDVAGQHLVRRLATGGGRIQRPTTPGLAFVTHTLAVTELFVRLTEAERRGELELLEFASEPACWRHFAGPGGGRVSCKPDAFVRVGLGDYADSWFVEVDRATESLGVIARKLDFYRAYWASGREQQRGGVFPGVLVLVPDERRQSALVTVVCRQPADARALFAVVTYAEAIAVIASGVEP